MTFITRLLGSLTTWLIAGLLAFGVYYYGQAQRLEADRDQVQQQVERAEARAEILLEHQRWQREQLQRMATVLTDRDAQLQRDGELLDLVRQAGRELERNDAEAADWAAQPSPDAVRDWLRDLPIGADDGTDSGSTQRAPFPADTPAASGPRGEAQP